MATCSLSVSPECATNDAKTRRLAQSTRQSSNRSYIRTHYRWIYTHTHTHTHTRILETMSAQKSYVLIETVSSVRGDPARKYRSQPTTTIVHYRRARVVSLPAPDQSGPTRRQQRATTPATLPGKFKAQTMGTLG